MYVTLRGGHWLLWRAADEHGIELDILLQKRCDKAAAKRFFKRVLAGSLAVPKKSLLTSYAVTLPRKRRSRNSQT